MSDFGFSVPLPVSVDGWPLPSSERWCASDSVRLSWAEARGQLRRNLSPETCLMTKNVHAVSECVTAKRGRLASVRRAFGNKVREISAWHGACLGEP